ncbi:hypothetical protein BDA99DRAFT_539770 [Phascolomyces articulosus]|uniref:PAN2-PAN3 deadenylation complex catalytic subunit PAN2 N-terminal domain-containing protein n=1 Tax=Phascolomyces articulosus TaxID=60185 RepID=A0AAD5JUX6_9FUNG|nr:hypothetical protein BDA99DRAFT_539770 [Phascolomyces articulosus]
MSWMHKQEDDDMAIQMDTKETSFEPIQHPIKNTTRNNQITKERMNNDAKLGEVRVAKIIDEWLPEFEGPFGNWVPYNSPIPGHSRYGSKKLKKAIDAVENDHLEECDEYVTSPVYPYYYKRVASHIYKWSGRVVKSSWTQVQSICDQSIDKVSPVSALTWDPYFELLWVGNDAGRVSSYYGDGLQRYTSFKAHKNEQVRQIRLTDRGVITLSSTSIQMRDRRGLVRCNVRYYYCNYNNRKI